MVKRGSPKGAVPAFPVLETVERIYHRFFNWQKRWRRNFAIGKKEEEEG
jgi:hypothetical protein